MAIVDPPRTGLSPAVCKSLRAAESIHRVLYVSCNPHGHTMRHDYVVKGGSLAANLRVLCGARGRIAPFGIRRVVPVDLFPHSPHVELCVLCDRMPARRSESAAARRERRNRSARRRDAHEPADD